MANEDNWFMKHPCKECPYRHDVKPYLHPVRGEELAYLAGNKYNSFYCHKTTVNGDDDEEGYSSRVCDKDTKMCAGFMTLQHSETGCIIPKGFTPAFEVAYTDIFEMVDAYNPDGIELEDDDVEDEDY